MAEPSVNEDFRTIYCDPGEDFGWALGKGKKLLAGGTDKLWIVLDDISAALKDPSLGMFAEGGIPDLREGVDPAENTGRIGRIVSEDWALYPDKLRFMKWDRCRTARGIGAMTMLTRDHMIPMVLQPAAIKKDALLAGAEQLFYKPLRPNRHANDAIQHFVYFVQVEMMKLMPGVKLSTASRRKGNPALDGLIHGKS